MNKKLVFLAMFSSFAVASAESLPETHDGFFLAFGLGLGSGNMKTEISGGNSTLTTTGTNSTFDFRIGGAVMEDLILHATLSGDAINSPKTTSSNGASGSPFSSVGMSLLGVGLTKYFMPLNAFVSTSGGLAKFSYQEKGASESKNIDGNGFGLQIKAGKEWWVSPNWALGASAVFNWATLTTDDYQIGTITLHETDTHRGFGVQFSATFQ
ncbi:MAG: DUF3575 domain-containing protein [Fibrobacterota bacterium]